MPPESSVSRRQVSGTDKWTRWCFETCLLYGCDPALAARVAAHFCDAIRPHVEPPHA